MTYDLSQIKITKRVRDSWRAYVGTAAKELLQKYLDLKATEIPDEQFRILPNGNGEIFVKIRGSVIKMAVPKEEYILK